jgi:pimeloyl-ACP methyl ester carboxylesterase
VNQFRRNGLVFDVLDTGPADGTPVVLLHGFPQAAVMWNAVAARLHEAGYRTIAPDQRGASPGARPTRRRDYRMPELVDDLVALIDGIGPGPVHVVGHDWGGAAAWMLAAWHPEKVRTLTAVCAPHLGAFLQSGLRSRQLLASWYMYPFQIRGLPERVFDVSTPAGRRRFQRFLDYFGAAQEDVERDVARLGQGGVRGGLMWYRAIPLLPFGRLFRSKVAAPTLVVTGDRDVAVLRSGLELSLRYCTGPARLEVLHGINHWVPNQAPDELAKLILGHLAAT